VQSFRILLAPLTYIPAGEAHHVAIDALRASAHPTVNYVVLTGRNYLRNRLSFLGNYMNRAGL